MLPSVMSVDPGKVTGYGLYLPYDAESPEFGMTDDWYRLVDMLGGARPDVLVVERFTINNRTAQRAPDGLPLRIIGALEYEAWKCNTEVVFQNPSTVMRLVTDDLLKTLGWYTPGPDHANDAARHMAFYLQQHDIEPAASRIEEAMRESIR